MMRSFSVCIGTFLLRWFKTRVWFVIKNKKSVVIARFGSRLKPVTLPMLYIDRFKAGITDQCMFTVFALLLNFWEGTRSDLLVKFLTWLCLLYYYKP